MPPKTKYTPPTISDDDYNALIAFEEAVIRNHWYGAIPDDVLVQYLDHVVH